MTVLGKDIVRYGAGLAFKLCKVVRKYIMWIN